MKAYRSIRFAACAAFGLSLAATAAASSHREAPGITDDPAADLTDVYAFTCNENGVASLCIVANSNPLELPEGGPNFHKFSDDVLYQLHLTHNDQNGIPSLLDFAVVEIQFNTDAIVVVDPADQEAGVGGGKEFFAQLAGSFNQQADVRIRKVAFDNQRGNDTDNFENSADLLEDLFIGAKVAPPNIGQRTSTLVNGDPDYANFAQQFVVSNDRNFKFFAGPRDDAFFVNLGQVFDLGAFVGLNELNGQPFRSRIFDVDPDENGQFANTDPNKALDGVAGLNVHSIAISIPLTELAPPGREVEFADAVASGVASNETLFGVWASTSRRITAVSCGPDEFNDPECQRGGFRRFGPFRQVARLGFPLVNEVLIGVQDKDRFNRSSPFNDVNEFAGFILNPVLVRDVEAVGGFAQLGIDPVPDDFKFGRVDIIQVLNIDNFPVAGAHAVPIENGRTGDVLRVDVAVDSSFPNGRPLAGAAVANGKEQDVTDIALSVVLAKGAIALTDFVGGPGDGRALLPEFPFLGLPFAGDEEGKGDPAAL